MMDYEDLILDMQESEMDDCKTCPYKRGRCRNQCLEMEEHYNPALGIF